MATPIVTPDAAVDLADLVQQLLDAGERRAREGVAQRILQTLKEAQEPAPPPAPELPPLVEIAHRESNGLFDVLALLRSAEERIDECGGYQSFRTDKDYAHDTLRLLQLARERVQQAQHAFDPYI
ncbi:hypothetical protein [Rubrivivax albus]|uniref:Uncharacterized protein n=1 Tax=Rubrivivax albus TaxID=2499835 RepID=A0A437JNI1_9BURK|nr:hypothetical protein [Rubrivivax albus]RVT48380.1 hypothetical protein ENE75_22045 [Rubrivivax albus]